MAVTVAKRCADNIYDRDRKRQQRSELLVTVTDGPHHLAWKLL